MIPGELLMARPDLSVDPLVAEAVAQSMRDLPARFLPERADRVTRRYLLAIDGCPPWTVVVHGGRCLVWPTASPTADALLMVDAPTWLRIAFGETTGIEAFFEGKLRVSGDLNEALRLETLFAPPRTAPARLRQGKLTRYDLGPGFGEVEVLEAGDPEAPPVLLLHGLGASKVSLLPVVAGLASERRVLALDFPGFGKSDAPVRARYDAAWFADSVEATLDAVGVRRAAFVGNSLGGRVALEFALRHPERVDALALLCPAVAFNEYRLVRPLLGVSRADVVVGMAPWPLVGRYPRGAVEAGIRSLFAVPGRVPADNVRAAAEDALRTLRDHRRRVALLATMRQLGLERPARFWPRLAGLERPSLWIFGDADRLVSPGYAAMVRRNAPGAQVEVWDSCGHVPQFEYPERTVARLRAFLPAPVGRGAPRAR